MKDFITDSSRVYYEAPETICVNEVCSDLVCSSGTNEQLQYEEFEW